MWSPRITEAIKQNKIHINMMEFVVVILQLAATIAIVEEQPQNPELSKEFYPRIPETGKIAHPNVTTPRHKTGRTKSPLNWITDNNWCKRMQHYTIKHHKQSKATIASKVLQTTISRISCHAKHFTHIPL
jgi:hypothetical protein